MSRFLLRLLALIYFAIFVACILMSAGLVEMLPIYDLYYQSFPDHIFIGPLLLLVFSVICWLAAGAPPSTEYEDDAVTDTMEDETDTDVDMESPTLVMKRTALDMSIAEMEKEIPAALRKDVPVALREESDLACGVPAAVAEPVLLEKAAGAEDTFAVSPRPPQEKILVEVPHKTSESVKPQKQKKIRTKPELRGMIRRIGRRSSLHLEEKIAPFIYRTLDTKSLARIGSWTARGMSVIGVKIHDTAEQFSKKLSAGYSGPLEKNTPPPAPAATIPVAWPKAKPESLPVIPDGQPEVLSQESDPSPNESATLPEAPKMTWEGTEASSEEPEASRAEPETNLTEPAAYPEEEPEASDEELQLGQDEMIMNLDEENHDESEVDSQISQDEPATHSETGPERLETHQDEPEARQDDTTDEKTPHDEKVHAAAQAGQDPSLVPPSAVRKNSGNTSPNVKRRNAKRKKSHKKKR